MYLIPLLFFFFNTIPHSVYIIIHGTWSSNAAWYQPGGDFFDAVEKTARNHNATTTPFCWSGYNSLNARDNAAQNLAQLIDSYEKNTTISVIGHSHGGTVALLASHLLKKNTIDILYTLGTPISKAIYPNMIAINYCYNLFSFEDLIQPVFGIFNREHVPHERIANIRIFINGKEPDHTELHHPLVGQWLPQLHDYLQTNTSIKTSEPGIIYFDNTRAPIYIHDTIRTDLLERDHQLSLLMLNSLRKPLDIESKIPLTNR